MLGGSKGLHDVVEQRAEGGGAQLGRDLRPLPREVGGRHRYRLVWSSNHERKKITSVFRGWVVLLCLFP